MTDSFASGLTGKSLSSCLFSMLVFLAFLIFILLTTALSSAITLFNTKTLSALSAIKDLSEESVFLSNLILFFGIFCKLTTSFLVTLLTTLLATFFIFTSKIFKGSVVIFFSSILATLLVLATLIIVSVLLIFSISLESSTILEIFLTFKVLVNNGVSTCSVLSFVTLVFSSDLV